MRSLSFCDTEDKDDIFWNAQANAEDHLKSHNKIDISKVYKASNYFSKNETVTQSSFTKVELLSELFGCNVYLKREDQQLGTILILQKPKPSRSEESTVRSTLTGTENSQTSTLPHLMVTSLHHVQSSPRCTRVLLNLCSQIPYFRS